MRFVAFEQFFAQLSKKEFLQYAAAFAVILLCICAGSTYFYLRSRASLYKKIQLINKKRDEIKSLLARSTIVEKQKDDVSAILAREKDFKLADAFNKAVTKAGLESKKGKDDLSSPEKVLPGYAEIRLTCRFEGIDMQQLVKLLQELEQNDRINTKELEIDRAGSGLNVKIGVATIEPLVQTVE